MPLGAARLNTISKVLAVDEPAGEFTAEAVTFSDSNFLDQTNNGFTDTKQVTFSAWAYVASAPAVSSFLFTAGDARYTNNGFMFFGL